MKRLAIIAAILALAMGVTYVIGVPDDAVATVGTTGQYATPATNAVTSQGGNVTAVNVSSNQTTQKWQGFWGNVSGALTLGDGTSVFYDWSSVTFQAVFASPGNNIDWTTATGLNGSANRSAKDTDYGFNSADPDSINSTMGGENCDAGTIMFSADGVTAYNSTGGAGNWTTCLGEDGGAALDDSIFGTTVNTAGSNQSYNAQRVQYQLMVPVIAADDDYFFYLEI